MSERHRLSNRRVIETVAFEHEEQRYKAGLGRDVVWCGADGLPVEGSRPSRTATTLAIGPIEEIFLNAQKANSPLDVLASDGAILMSILLQYGCPPADIHHAMKRNPDGSPASPLGRAAKYLVESEPSS